MSEHGHDGIGSAGDSHNHREHHDGQRTGAGEDESGSGEDAGGEAHDHDHHDHDVSDLGVGVVTVSTSRSIEDDPAGDAIRDAFEDSGHQVTVRELIDDSFDGVQSTVNRLVGRDDVDIVVTTGGTGVTPDDVTVEAVTDLMHKTLPGFGELFRRLSYDEIGTRVVGTRTTAGIADHTPVFCLPGSENAARLGAEEILVPEAPHLAGLASRE
ncbi:MogA/MoaB family molybdenum cofactor biosynthesis protein [Halogeometricum sp. S1BR25-6]|uniref:MogA/MoaB family molybdenum cofactor biosynthesis protein n=1 Tax=Halogeometricum salsisoli TaxID=2950536 RepID=A0ABU2GHA4_9EURY|nr:MogA/MoaB family molybdenum cofactor biosynthesis protein [Halogeometricum sp. S1BR25-6]MDS0299483.1 MogA/MoaB family molybdenum cofactor biosynthesis protein [Halogeometricum sp. S1BR25-6]